MFQIFFVYIFRFYILNILLKNILYKKIGRAVFTPLGLLFILNQKDLAAFSHAILPSTDARANSVFFTVGFRQSLSY